MEDKVLDLIANKQLALLKVVLGSVFQPIKIALTPDSLISGKASYLSIKCNGLQMCQYTPSLSSLLGEMKFGSPNQH